MLMIANIIVLCMYYENAARYIYIQKATFIPCKQTHLHNVIWYMGPIGLARLCTERNLNSGYTWGCWSCEEPALPCYGVTFLLFLIYFLKIGKGGLWSDYCLYQAVTKKHAMDIANQKILCTTVNQFPMQSLEKLRKQKLSPFVQYQSPQTLSLFFVWVFK